MRSTEIEVGCKVWCRYRGKAEFEVVSGPIQGPMGFPVYELKNGEEKFVELGIKMARIDLAQRLEDGNHKQLGLPGVT